MMKLGEKLGLLRLIAFAIDWFVIAAWGGLLFGLILLSSDGYPKPFSGPLEAQAVGFLTMTLPVTLYFAILESSKFGASIGKHLVGLRVRSLHGGSLTFRQSFLRTVFKFAPWELGHLVAQQAMFSLERGVPVWVYLPMLLSFLLPLWWVVSLLLNKYAPYDSWAGARVEKSRS